VNTELTIFSNRNILPIKFVAETRFEKPGEKTFSESSNLSPIHEDIQSLYRDIGYV